MQYFIAVVAVIAIIFGVVDLIANPKPEAAHVPTPEERLEAFIGRPVTDLVSATRAPDDVFPNAGGALWVWRHTEPFADPITGNVTRHEGSLSVVVDAAGITRAYSFSGSGFAVGSLIRTMF